MKSIKKWKACSLAITAVLAMSMLLVGCGSNNQKGQGQAKQVKAISVLQQDTPLTSEYAGQIRGKNEVKVQSRVSGTVVEKFVKGGDYVQAGQPLYKIDSRQYESAVNTAQANLAQAQATLSNARIDLARDEELLQSAAVAEQIVTTQQANVNAYQAVAEANASQLRTAQQNLDDTVVYAPMSGKLSVDDVAVGTYAAAGNTTLVTLGSESPIYAEFNISETDYLKFMNGSSSLGEGVTRMVAPTVSMRLSDGSVYPLNGTIVAADRTLSNNSGTLTVKAQFDNPNHMLIPGMFARIRLSGEVVPNAILVPQRAIQQLLGKTFVMVVGDDNKSVAKSIKIGQKVGNYVIVEEGLDPSDMVIVEGLTNLTEGVPLNVTTVTAEDMGFSLDADTEDPDAPSSNS